jgi:hypothetical protein
MKRQGGSRGPTPQDRNQLSLDWEASAREIETAPARGQVPAKPLKVRSPRKRHTDVVAKLPVPRPLPGSIAAGHFGHDDDGKAIRPEADEIRAITESLADRLIDLLDAMREVTQENARQAMQEQFSQAIQMYALEFGERPARQLEAYSRRQASLDEDQRSGGKGWQR